MRTVSALQDKGESSEDGWWRQLYNIINIFSTMNLKWLRWQIYVLCILLQFKKKKTEKKIPSKMVKIETILFGKSGQERRQ